MTQIPSQFDFTKLSVPDRIALIGEIWDSINQENEAPELTPAQRSELEHRLEAQQRSPEDVVSWDEIRDELKSQRDESVD